MASDEVPPLRTHTAFSWRRVLYVTLGILVVMFIYQFNWFPTTWEPPPHSLSSVVRSTSNSFVATAEGPSETRPIPRVDGTTGAALETSSRVIVRPIGQWTRQVVLPVFGVRAIAFSQNQQLSAAASSDYVVQVWRLADTNAQYTFPNIRRVNTLAFSADSQFLAAGSEFGAVWMWNLRTGHLLFSKEIGVPVTNIAFSPSGQLLAIVPTSSSHPVDIFFLPDGTPWTSMAVSNDQPFAAAFSPDGHWLAIGLSKSAWWAG